MSTEFKREERYIVFKISDAVEHLTTTEMLHLKRLYEIQRVGRKEAGKSELECVVVESDWPEYEPTWRAIEARVTGTQNIPKAVAYLDLGTGGYMDIGTDLTDEELATLPKGRHMLGIIGTYGVDGYVPVQPAPSIPEGWTLVPIEVIYLYSIMCAAFVPMTPQQKEIALQLELAKRAMLAVAPEAKP